MNLNPHWEKRLRNGVCTFCWMSFRFCVLFQITYLIYLYSFECFLIAIEDINVILNFKNPFLGPAKFRSYSWQTCLKSFIRSYCSSEFACLLSRDRLSNFLYNRRVKTKSLLFIHLRTLYCPLHWSGRLQARILAGTWKFGEVMNFKTNCTTK